MPNAEDFSVGFNSWCVMTHPKKANYSIMPYQGTTLFTDGWVLPVISGNILRTLNVPTVNSYFLPDQLTTTFVSENDEIYHTKEVKSQIRGGYGTYTFQGSVDFEMTNAMTGLLDVNVPDTNGNDDDIDDGGWQDDPDNLRDYGPFFRRNSIFHIQFYDGKRNCTVRNCAWSDFSISGSPNSAVRTNINFHSNNGYYNELDINDGNLGEGRTFNSEDFLLPYWRCGAGGIMEFTLSISRSVTPVFLNNSLYVPSYLRVGMATVSLQMTCLNPNTWNSVIYIGGKKITFNGPVLQSSDYQMTTISDVGTKSYTWSSIVMDSIDPVFKIQEADETHQEPVEK